MTTPIFYYVDHTSRFVHNTGIQRCVRLLAMALIDAGQPLVPVVWDRERGRFAAPSAQALAHLAQCHGPPIGAWHAWRDPGACAQGWLLIVELVRGLNNPTAEQLRAAAPGLRLAWLFHDAIPWQQAVRAGCPDAPAAVAHARYMAAIAMDARVFCNSRSSRIDLLCFLAEYGHQPVRQLATRIRPLPLAETFPTPRPSPPSIERSGPLRLLTVSTLERRKNHHALIKALVWLYSFGVQHWQLELIGWGADHEIVAMLRRARKVGLPLVWFGGVSDEQLHTAYAEADLCVYPSVQEGFGLPVVESLWHRRPCLCGDHGALAELAEGGGCLTVNTQQWPAIASALDQYIKNPLLRLKLGQQLEQRSYRTWKDVAQELLVGLHDLN